jgi:two-component system sensor histidine kinase KdpD
METRIFEKFTRGEKESAKPGIGLGLAICRAIAEAHGGKIGAANRVAADGRVEGARFWFMLPIETPPAVPDVADVPDEADMSDEVAPLPDDAAPLSEAPEAHAVHGAQQAAGAPGAHGSEAHNRQRADTHPTNTHS